jgi:hypothetical protein
MILCDSPMRKAAPDRGGGRFPLRSKPPHKYGRLRLKKNQLYSPGCEFLTVRLLPEGDGHRLQHLIFPDSWGAMEKPFNFESGSHIS